MTRTSLRDCVGFHIDNKMTAAMLAAAREGKNEPADFEQIKYLAAWEWLHYFRGAGKTSAYGTLQQAINDEANSHALRGFLVGWAAAMEFKEGTAQ